MIAGTVAVLDEPAADPVESFREGMAALDVEERYTYLDGASLQHGKAASSIETTREQVEIHGDGIDVDRVGSRERVATEWLADVTDAGFVVSERTAGSDPAFPFDVFWSATRQKPAQVRIDPGAFAREQDLLDAWYAGEKTPSVNEDDPDEVAMAYGELARVHVDPTEANIGLGFTVGWKGTTASGVLYASGYVALYESMWGPEAFGRFVREAILPIASVPEDDDGPGEQSTLGGV